MAPNHAAEPVEPLSPQDVIKTYRYLRIGMIGAVVLLAASIAHERSKVDCWQTSISAYYYTPVRAIFVGCMIAVGLSLIVYKGRSWQEDACLNFAGMLAPVVAIAPTTDVGRCWSLAPSPLPVRDDASLADWVVANISNNFYALLIAGGCGLALAFFIAMAVKGSVSAPVTNVEKGTRRSLVVTAVVLFVAFGLSLYWSDFNTHAHGSAAFLMFVLLIGAVTAVAWEHRRELKAHGKERDKMWFWYYMAVAVLMALGGIFIAVTRIFGEHTVFALEAFEIVLFAGYWSLQTMDRWPEKVVSIDPGEADASL